VCFTVAGHSFNGINNNNIANKLFNILASSMFDSHNLPSTNFYNLLTGKSLIFVDVCNFKHRFMSNLIKSAFM